MRFHGVCYQKRELSSSASLALMQDFSMDTPESSPFANVQDDLDGADEADV